LQENVHEWADWDAYYAKEVERRTNGRVKIKIHWGESLGKVADFPELVSSGAVDIIATTPSYSPTWFPMMLPTNQIPFVMNTLDEALEVANTVFYEGPIPKMLEKNNMKLLFVDAYHAYPIFSKTPINTLADLKGKKIRTYGQYLPRVYQAVGAVPVDVPASELFESLQKGKIDACPWGYSSSYLNSIHEVAPYVCDAKLGYQTGIIRVMNLNTWNKLPDDIKVILEEVGKDMKNVGRDIQNKCKDESVEALKKEGATISEFNDREKWVNMLPDFRKEWVEDMEKKGLGEDAKELNRLLEETLKRVRCS